MANLHVMNCDEPWYSKLENGTKEVEGRKGSPKHRSIKSGDKILFCCGEYKQFFAVVKKVDYFDSLDDYLRTVTLAKALPGIKTLEEGRKIYYQWSTEEEIEEEGFVAIWVSVK